MEREFIYWLNNKKDSMPLECILKYKQIFSNLKYKRSKLLKLVKKEEEEIQEEKQPEDLENHILNLKSSINEVKQEQLLEELLYDKLKLKKSNLEKDLIILKKRKYEKDSENNKNTNKMKNPLDIKKISYSIPNCFLVEKKITVKKFLTNKNLLKTRKEDKKDINLKKKKKERDINEIRLKIKNNLILI